MRFQQLVERILNNNAAGFFYLRAEPELGLPEDQCAFLALSVPIRREHYQICVEARILHLTEVFQAKLGWLVGDAYSRVGTKDWEPAELRKHVRKLVNEAAVWVPDARIKGLESAVTQWRQGNPDGTLDRETLAALLSGLPSGKQRVIDRVKSLLSESLLFQRLFQESVVSQGEFDRLFAKINSDQQLSVYLNQ